MSEESDARVAIVIRTKDRPDMLRRAISSICGQSFRDWQAVIVNDGGDAAQVESLLDAQPEAVRSRFRAVHAEATRGRWVSANAGVLRTDAPLVVLHDDDDTWHPEFLERATAYLDAHPEQPGALSRIEIVHERMRGGDLEESGREMFEPDLTVVTLSHQLRSNRLVPIGFLYRRSLHEELGLYDETLAVVGDWEFYLKILARGPLEYIDETPYAYWHQRRNAHGDGANSVHGADSDHRTYDALVRDRALRHYVDEHGIGALLYLTKYIDERLVETEYRTRHPLEKIYRKLKRNR